MLHSIKTALFIVALAVGVAACQKNDQTADKGPAEKAGEKLDQAATKAGEELNKAAEKAGQGLQSLGQKLENQAQQAQQAEPAQPAQPEPKKE